MVYYIQVTFDTEGIKRNFLNPSKDSENPTEIEESFCYMVASSKNLTGSRSHQLELIKTEQFEKVRFYGASASNNFEDAAMIYSVARLSKHEKVSKPYKAVFLENAGTCPSLPDTLPPQIIENEQFFFLESDAWFIGKKTHEISFALYARNNMGQPSLYGYFKYTAVFKLRQVQ